MKRRKLYTVGGRHWCDHHGDDHPPRWTVVATGLAKSQAEFKARVASYSETVVRPGRRLAFERWAREAVA